MSLPWVTPTPLNGILKNRMKLINIIAALGLALILGGCASTSKAPLREMRAFAAESAKLGAFAELTTRYRDTYQREQPYLSPAADLIERQQDAQRRAAYEDFIHIQESLVLYMQALGKLAGDDEYDFSDHLKKIGAGVKAWPDSGLDARHVTAYTTIGRLIGQMLSASYQERSARALVMDGAAPVDSLLDAMVALLRYYDKTNGNEKKIVLGMFEIEIPFADAPGDRLLSTLAKAHYQSKAAEYGLVQRRYALAERNLAAIAEGHRRLVAHLAGAPVAPAPALLESSRAIRASRVELDAPAY